MSRFSVRCLCITELCYKEQRLTHVFANIHALIRPPCFLSTRSLSPMYTRLERGASGTTALLRTNTDLREYDTGVRLPTYDKLDRSALAGAEGYSVLRRTIRRAHPSETVTTTQGFVDHLW